MNKFKVRVDHSGDEELNLEEGWCIAEVWDASEQYLPDFTPDWLYKLLETLPGQYDEFMESMFECDETFLEALKNHPDCILFEEIEGDSDSDEEDDEDEDDDWDDEEDDGSSEIW